MYIHRHAEKTVQELARMFGAVLVAGPRQVGKTTMLGILTDGMNYATLDDPILRASAVEESGTFFKDNPPPVFVDEIQKAPAFVVCLYDKLITLRGADKVIPINFL